MDHLFERIKKIEALILRASTDGEKNAAISAKERVVKKYPELNIEENPVEYRLSTNNMWNKKLLLAICRKYGVEPYRYHRQKYTTVMVKINRQFLNNVLWKEYEEYSDLLNTLIEEITDDLISKIYVHKEEDLIRGELG